MKVSSIFLLFLIFSVNNLFAQVVNGIASTDGCVSGGVITASATGLGTTPQFQLLRAGVVIAPVPGDATQYTNVNVFTGLVDGTYTLNARTNGFGATITSAVINLSNHYTDMVISAPIVSLSCVGTVRDLPVSVSGGRAPYIYSIKNSATNAVIQTSTAINATSFTFAALPVGSYVVSLTDKCGQTITTTTSIINPAVSIADVVTRAINYFQKEPSICNNPIKLFIQSGFGNVNGANLTAAEKNKFSWKIKYNGNLYGQDTNADGYPDLNANGFPLDFTFPNMPLGITRDDILNNLSAIKVVLLDDCGNTKEFATTYFSGIITPTIDCINGSRIRMIVNPSLVCMPIDYVFTNINNPSDVVKVRQSYDGEYLTGFTAGAVYNFTYADANGVNVNVFPSSRVTFPANSSTLNINQLPSVANVNYLGYGTLSLNIIHVALNTPINYTVTASTNPLVPVGTTGATLANIQYFPRVNITDPVDYWPKGTYTLAINSQCGSGTITVTVAGHEINHSSIGYVTEATCGGFNYTMTGTFTTPSSYEVYIISGPSNVGLAKDMANSTASLPFTNLIQGNYTIGLRIKGGSRNIFTQNVSYSAANVITVDKSKTGGYVCTVGAKTGTLTITASSISPNAGAALRYALSTDGGLTFGSFQSANTFTNLEAGSYAFKVEDGCSNVVTQIAQIGVAAGPVATAITSKPVICSNENESIQLDVDITGASYVWSGPGITNANKTLKNPVVNARDLAIGTNSFTVTVTLGAPCNVSNQASVVVHIAQAPLLNVKPQSACWPNSVDLTADAVIAGSTSGLTYTYYTNASGTSVLANPNAVSVSGTYYIKGGNGDCFTDIKPVVVTINDLPTAVISYSSATFCQRGTASVTTTGQIGGVYTASSGLRINSSTGTIDLANSTLGSHTVSYTFSNGTCSNIATTTLTINATVMPPTLANVTAQCAVTPLAPSLVDNCSGTITASTTTPFPITAQGTTVVTWTFNYGNGFIKTSTQNIIINDTTAPLAPVLPDINWQCGINIIAPTTTDNCSGTVTGTTNDRLTYTTQGIHQINWKFTDAAGNSTTAIQQVIVTSLPVPVLTIVAQPTCATRTGRISITPVAGNTYSVDGTNYVSSTIFDLAPGSYSVTMKTPNGCITAAATVQIDAQPIIPIAAINYSASPYQPIGTAVVTRTGQEGGVYTAVPDGLDINAVTGLINLANSKPEQTYVISYTFSNGVCANVATTTLKINPIPTEISYAQTKFCSIGSASVIVKGQAGGEYTVNPEGLKLDAFTGGIDLANSRPGTYVVSYAYKNGSVISSTTTTVTVYAMPIVTLAGPQSAISKGDIVNIQATGGASYRWAGPDIISGQATTALVVRPRQTTTYELTTTNSNGCSVTSYFSIQVEEDNKIYPNNVITPNGDGKNDTWLVNNIDYYPNNQVSIYDRAGRKIFSSLSYKNDWDGTINGIPLAQGAYIYVIDLGKGKGLIKGTLSIIR